MQLKGVVFTFVYCFVVSWAILGAIKLTVGLRASREEEEQGLDLAEHNERAYNSLIDVLLSTGPIAGKPAPTGTH